MFRVAVDIGGTFTDAVSVSAVGEIRTAKAPTTPGRLADGVLDALAGLDIDPGAVRAFVHGTTAGLNALLERRGASVAVITTNGFRDVYEIGRAIAQRCTTPATDMLDRSYAGETSSRSTNGSTRRELCSAPLARPTALAWPSSATLPTGSSSFAAPLRRGRRCRGSPRRTRGSIHRVPGRRRGRPRRMIATPGARPGALRTQEEHDG